MNRLRLSPPGTGVGFIGELAVPADLYWVAREPVPLAGMAYPGRVDWRRLACEGIGHVVCLSHDDPPYDPTPCSLTAVALENLFAGGSPREPEREEALVLAAAGVVVASIRAGTGVAVHCLGGRGRAGTVIGAAVVQLGHDPDEVVDHLHRLHVHRGRKDGWPESAWQEAVVRAAAGDAPRTWMYPTYTPGTSIRSTARNDHELADPKYRAVPKRHT